LATRTVGVPIGSGIESLNVAVSAGIFLYELRP
jgi:tRNA G18 (ribose-2'-O)-methylase SpoU